MADFVIIAPAGWTSIDLDYVINTLNISLDEVKDYANVGVYSNFEQLLKDTGLIPVDKFITAMKVIDDSQLWVTLG